MFLVFWPACRGRGILISVNCLEEGEQNGGPQKERQRRAAEELEAPLNNFLFKVLSVWKVYPLGQPLPSPNTIPNLVVYWHLPKFSLQFILRQKTFTDTQSASLSLIEKVTADARRSTVTHCFSWWFAEKTPHKRQAYSPDCLPTGMDHHSKSHFG